MQLKILTPTQTLYNDQVLLVQVPGSDGSFEILENHAPIISTLENGRIKVIDFQKQTYFFDITGGMLECKMNTVIVLAENGCETPTQ
jgi:F-type H+-transporting ATPase subunit epsilon